MKRNAILVAALVVVVAVAFLGYDLLKGVVSPCETIYEQTALRLGTKLEVLETKGELHLGREKIQELTEAAQLTALNLKTCCIVLNAGGVDSGEFLQCKATAESYESDVDTAISAAESASDARDAGDDQAYGAAVSRLEAVLLEAEQTSQTLKQEVEAIVERQESAAGSQPSGNPEESAEQKMGEIAFTWDGRSDARWHILKSDAAGTFAEVAQAGPIQKGATEVVELPAGAYRVELFRNHGFEPADVTVVAGRQVEIRPDFGTITFQWDARSQVYWKVLEADAYGDYFEVAETGYLQKQQTQTLEMAPGTYRVQMNRNSGFDPEEVTVVAGEDRKVNPVFGTLTFQWDGRNRSYWDILEADSYGDYFEVAETGWLLKGESQTLEMAPGDYRLQMGWSNGFTHRDVTVTAGQDISIRPDFGTVVFQWDSAERAYWETFQKDSYGDLFKVAETGWLQDGQSQGVELAPGDYWLRRSPDGPEATGIALQAGEEILVTE